MQPLRDMEIGVMFWAGRDPLETVRELKDLGVRCGQLAIPGDLDLEGAAEAWRPALDAEQFTLVTVFAAYKGEDYADIPTVQRTVGFIPPATRAEREARTFAISDFAAALGVPSIATHIGFVPEDMAHPDYVAVRDMVRRVCDHAAGRAQTFALETGQEPAHVLLKFFQDVDRSNLRINFDPANMIHPRRAGHGEAAGARLGRHRAVRQQAEVDRLQSAAEHRTRGHGPRRASAGHPHGRGPAGEPAVAKLESAPQRLRDSQRLLAQLHQESRQHQHDRQCRQPAARRQPGGRHKEQER
jgi:hypothetical protein